MLLGDTLILDELDSANAYRQEVKWFFESDWLILKQELDFPQSWLKKRKQPILNIILQQVYISLVHVPGTSMYYMYWNNCIWLYIIVNHTY